MVKRWDATFTCLNSRAVHLEIATSLETDCFINVFRQFINRRGLPKCIYSDNGSRSTSVTKGSLDEEKTTQI